MAKKVSTEIVKRESKELSLVEAEIARVQEALQNGPLFNLNPEDVELPVGVAAWAILDKLEELIQKRKAAYREHFFNVADNEGFNVEYEDAVKHSKYILVDGSKVTKEHRPQSLPSEDKVKDLLKSKNIPLDEAFDEVKSMEINPSKVEFLIDKGKLTHTEIDKLKSSTYALKVKKSKIIDKCLSEMEGALVNNNKLLK